jgi:large subunit ribosomal protein L19
MRPGKVRRAKLYYGRGKIGKGAKIKELIVKKKDKAANPNQAAEKQLPVS